VNPEIGFEGKRERDSKARNNFLQHSWGNHNKTKSVPAFRQENIHADFFNNKKAKSALGEDSRRQSGDCQYHGSDISIGNDTGGWGRREGAVRGQRSVAEGCGFGSSGKLVGRVLRDGLCESGVRDERRGGVNSRSEQRSCERSEQEVRSNFSTRVSGLFFNRKFPVLHNQFFTVVSSLFSHCHRFVAIHYYNINSGFIKSVFWKVSDLTNDNFLTMKMLYRRVINRLDSGIRALTPWCLEDLGCNLRSN